jgi:TetR/AcrR family transcriptional regulator, regulator of cefoperazone and chloramphenicol sensitivity
MFKKTRGEKAVEFAGNDQARTEILKAAEELFAEVGYETATIRGICNRAKKNIALVKYYFGDKEGLYAQVLRQCAQAARIDDVRSTLNAKGPPEEILRAAVKARLCSLYREDMDGRYFQILAWEFANPSRPMRQLVGQIARPMYERLLEVIAEILGLPASHQTTKLCVNSVIGQIVLYISLPGYVAQTWGDFKMTETKAEEIADHIVDFSLAYLKRRAPQNRASATKRRRK